MIYEEAVVRAGGHDALMNALHANPPRVRLVKKNGLDWYLFPSMTQMNEQERQLIDGVDKSKPLSDGDANVLCDMMVEMGWNLVPAIGNGGSQASTDSLMSPFGPASAPPQPQLALDACSHEERVAIREKMSQLLVKYDKVIKRCEVLMAELQASTGIQVGMPTLVLAILDYSKQY